MIATDLDSLHGLKLLDIGCGNGGGLAFLTDYLQPSISVGIDNNPSSIVFARENFPKVKFVNLEAETLAH